MTVGDNEVYAPNYRDGEKVALVRFPHESKSQIPILTVNNKIQEGRDILGPNPPDAVMINKKVADRMSGADFDGDSVLIIPTNNKVRIKNEPQFEDLKTFDGKVAYGPDSIPGRKYNRLSKSATQIEMGKISNLITDMTLQGANEGELVRAIKHSMVVIDAAKHNLDWQRSEEENGIAQLKAYYQPKDENGKGGAATLISRSSSPEYVTKRRGTPYVNQEGKPWYDPNRPQGALIYKESQDAHYIDKNGKQKTRTEKTTRMDLTDDAMTLVSKARTPQELAYAHYANQMKAFANQARMEITKTGDIKYSASAKRVYQAEVDSLDAKLNIAERNAPRERQALAIANANINAKKQAYPDMDKAELKKLRQRELIAARTKVGAQRHEVDITPREWEAIQSGGISPSKLQRILNHADIDKVRDYATPHSRTKVSDAKAARINAMKANGYTTQEIADAIGVSRSTVSNYLKGDK